MTILMLSVIVYLLIHLNVKRRAADTQAKFDLWKHRKEMQEKNHGR